MKYKSLITILLWLFVICLFILSCHEDKNDSSFGDIVDDDITDNDTDNDVSDDDDISFPFDLQAMTFNLRNGMAVTDGENWWPYRKDIVCNLISQKSPDIIGTQEGWKFQLDYIKNKLPSYEWVGLSRRGNQFDEFCAIFYKTERFSLINTGTFWLSDTPDVAGSKFSDKQQFPRIVTWAEFKVIDSGLTFFVFNTHFDTYNGDDVPEKSAALLASKIKEIAGGAPVVVTGDFNEYVESNAYKILIGEMEYNGVSGSLIDPWRILELPEEGTTHGFTGLSNDPSRIDWVLCSEQFTPMSGEVSHYNESGRYPSDHFPVLVELELSNF